MFAKFVSQKFSHHFWKSNFSKIKVGISLHPYLSIGWSIRVKIAGCGILNGISGASSSLPIKRSNRGFDHWDVLLSLDHWFFQMRNHPPCKPWPLFFPFISGFHGKKSSNHFFFGCNDVYNRYSCFFSGNIIPRIVQVSKLLNKRNRSLVGGFSPTPLKNMRKSN